MEKSGHGGSWARIEAPQVTKLRQLVISGAALGTTSERLQFEFDNGAVGPGGAAGRLQRGQVAGIVQDVQPDDG